MDGADLVDLFRFVLFMLFDCLMHALQDRFTRRRQRGACYDCSVEHWTGIMRTVLYVLLDGHHTRLSQMTVSAT